MSELEIKISRLCDKLLSHVKNLNNPHNIGKQHIDLGNIDNTKDIDKPVSRRFLDVLREKADISSYQKHIDNLTENIEDIIDDNGYDWLMAIYNNPSPYLDKTLSLLESYLQSNKIPDHIDSVSSMRTHMVHELQDMITAFDNYDAKILQLIESLSPITQSLDSEKRIDFQKLLTYPMSKLLSKSNMNALFGVDIDIYSNAFNMFLKHINLTTGTENQSVLSITSNDFAIQAINGDISISCISPEKINYSNKLPKSDINIPDGVVKLNSQHRIPYEHLPSNYDATFTGFGDRLISTYCELFPVSTAYSSSVIIRTSLNARIDIYQKLIISSYIFQIHNTPNNSVFITNNDTVDTKSNLNTTEFSGFGKFDVMIFSDDNIDNFDRFSMINFSTSSRDDAFLYSEYVGSGNILSNLYNRELIMLI